MTDLTRGQTVTISMGEDTRDVEVLDPDPSEVIEDDCFKASLDGSVVVFPSREQIQTQQTTLADEPEVRADGGKDDAHPPAPDVAVGDRVRCIMQHDGDTEYVEGIAVTVHSQRTIDAVYRAESRAEHGGDGSFGRDHHTDSYQFQTSLVYMADVAGWLAGWEA